jgi:predicted AAA+ superfamily ATPase
VFAELEQRAASIGPLVWRDGAPTRDLYHWRLGSGQEVDFIPEQNRQLLPVEVKAADPEIRVSRQGVIGCPWWAVL